MLARLLWGIVFVLLVLFLLQRLLRLFVGTFNLLFNVVIIILLVLAVYNLTRRRSS